MVLTRKVVYGFNGYSAPDIPRAPRSIRKRGLHKKAIEEGQLCAFDLLATVAGKLLQENESFSSSSTSSAALGVDHYEAGQNAIKTEKIDVDNSIRTENDDQGSSQESVFYSGLRFQNCDKKEAYKENGSEANAENASIVVSSACSGKTDFDVKSIAPKSKDKFVKIHCKIEEGSPKCGESDNTTMGDGIIKQSKVTGETDEDFTAANKFSPKYPADLCRSTTRSTSLFRYRTNVKIGGTDNDEILSRCSQLSTKAKADSSPACTGDRRRRKLLTSQRWKVAPKLQESEPSNSGSNLKHFYNNRKSCYAHEQSESDTPLKKRKLLDQSSVVSQDGGISSESVSNLPEKGTEDRKGKGASPSVVGHQRSSDSRNSPVKFTIKSFKVPELFIEVPKCATVGSLKRTVLEAVTAIIGDGLRVGVLMEGKKIRDDNKTLLQSGISQNDNLDSLGFMLEPISPKPPPSLSPDESSAPLTYVSPKDIVNRTQVFQKVPSFPVDGPDNHSVPDLGSQAGGSLGLTSSPAAEVLAKKTVPDSKALVPISKANMEALAIVPPSLRPKHSEIGQRRTRRPFSVVEVEALVQAVEKLGTGRWRDVKLCAFENANLRTYVDLKDKWKTLVHTARISPQQRRGEPVPQKLLDRVLVAHAFWSQHQAKQNGKQQQQPGFLRLTDTYEPAERQQSCVDFL